jgi:hypothetical protein
MLKDDIMALREGGNESDKNQAWSLPAFAAEMGWDLTPDPSEDTATKIDKAMSLAELFNKRLSEINPGSAAIHGVLNEKPIDRANPQTTLF